MLPMFFFLPHKSEKVQQKDSILDLVSTYMFCLKIRPIDLGIRSTTSTFLPKPLQIFMKGNDICALAISFSSCLLFWKTVWIQTVYTFMSQVLDDPEVDWEKGHVVRWDLNGTMWHKHHWLFLNGKWRPWNGEQWRPLRSTEVETSWFGAVFLQRGTGRSIWRKGQTGPWENF